MKNKLKITEIYGFKTFLTFNSVLLLLIAGSITLMCIFFPITLSRTDEEDTTFIYYIGPISAVALLILIVLSFGLNSFYLKPVCPFIHKDGKKINMKISSIESVSSSQQMEKMANAIAENGRKARFDNRLIRVYAIDELFGKRYAVVGFFADKADVKKMKVGDIWPCFVCDAFSESAVALKKPTSPKGRSAD